MVNGLTAKFGTGSKKHKYGMEPTARKLGLSVFNNKIHCLFGERHLGGKDRNPSCVLYDDHFHCYSCNAHGDAIDLVRKKLGNSFGEALAFLDGVFTAKSAAPLEPDYNCPASFSSVYHRMLTLAVPPTSENIAGQYLLRRGLSPDTAAWLGLRFLADSKQAETVLRHDFKPEELDAAGVIGSNGCFMFHNHQLLIPFCRKKTVDYLIGRSLEAGANPKEIKPKGVKCPYPFLIEFADFGNEIFVCEGAMDALSCVQMGHVAIGVPGANCFSKDWLEFIPKSSFLKIVFDSDEAGQHAASQLRDFLRRCGFRSEAFHVPAKDMNDLLLNSCGGGLCNGF